MKELKEIINTFKSYEKEKVDAAHILSTIQAFSMGTDQNKLPKLKQRLNNLEKALISYRLQAIHWPEDEPYSLIQDKKNIESIIQTLTPVWLVQDDNISTFKPIFQAFPGDWKDKYLHECSKTLTTEYYLEVYDELQTSDVLELSDDIKDTSPSAPPFEALAQWVYASDSSSSNDNLPIAHAQSIGNTIVHIGTQDLSSSIPDKQIIEIEREIKSEFWINVKGMSQEAFLGELKAIEYPEMIYQFISYMRNPPWMGAVRQNYNTIKKWIEGAQKNKTQFHLDELIYFSKHYQNLAEKIQGSSPKKTALINLSRDLLNLKSGLDLIYKSLQETSTPPYVRIVVTPNIE